MPPRQQSPEVVRPKYDRSVCRVRGQLSRATLSSSKYLGNERSKKLEATSSLGPTKRSASRRSGRPPTVIDMTGICAILALLPTKLATFPTVEVRRLRRKKDYR